MHQRPLDNCERSRVFQPVPESLFFTRRTCVRRLAIGDFEKFWLLQADPETHRWTGSQPEDKSSSLATLRRYLAAYDEPTPSHSVWAITRQVDKEFLGVGAVIHRNGEFEVGYRISRLFWGQGYASELIDPLIDFALSQTHIPEVTARVDVRNLASVRVLDKSQLRFIEEYHNVSENCTDRLYRSGSKPIQM